MSRRVVTAVLIAVGLGVIAWAVPSGNLVMVVPGALVIGAGALLLKPAQVE